MNYDRVFKEGQQAALDGDLRSSNPYAGMESPSSMEERLAWFDGWDDFQEDGLEEGWGDSSNYMDED